MSQTYTTQHTARITTQEQVIYTYTYAKAQAHSHTMRTNICAPAHVYITHSKYIPLVYELKHCVNGVSLHDIPSIIQPAINTHKKYTHTLPTHALPAHAESRTNTNIQRRGNMYAPEFLSQAHKLQQANKLAKALNFWG